MFINDILYSLLGERHLNFSDIRFEPGAEFTAEVGSMISIAGLQYRLMLYSTTALYSYSLTYFSIYKEIQILTCRTKMKKSVYICTCTSKEVNSYCLPTFLSASQTTHETNERRN